MCIFWGLILREIKQTWWHIQDQLSPTPGRLIRQVMDLYTDQNSFGVPLGDFNFVKLKVKNRNNGNELSFLEDENRIMVNLGDIKEWPKAKGCTNYKVRHVKLEIEYTLLNPPFNKHSWLDLLKERVIYTGSFEIKELIQPEFYITLPKGLRLKDKGNSLKMILGIKFEDDNLKKEMDKSGLKLLYSSESKKITLYDIKFETPYIDKKGKKESYSYLVNTENYKILKKYNKPLKNSKVIFGFHYKVTYDRKLFGTLVGLGILVTTIVAARIFYLIFNGGDGSFSLPFLIVLISYIALILKYHDEEYNLPIFKIIIIMAIIFVIWALTEIFCINPAHNTISILIK